MKRDYKSYAQALAQTALKDLSSTASKKATERFLEIVEKNGDRRQLAKIVTHAELLYMKKSGKHRVVVESAHPLSKSAQSDILKHLERKDVVEEKINPSLLAGVRITINGERELDMSFRRKLNKLFA